MDEVGKNHDQRRHTNYTTRNTNNKNKGITCRGNQKSITASGQKIKQDYRTQSDDDFTNSPSISARKADMKQPKSINASRITGATEDISILQKGEISYISSLDEFENMEEDHGLVRIMPAIDFVEVDNEMMEEGTEGISNEYRYNKKLQKSVKIHSVFKVPVIHKEIKYDFFGKRKEFTR